MSQRTPLDPITVGVIGNRLTSILNEQQTALVNTAFSSIVRESLDLACSVFDSKGEMIGQSVGGTPGHINAMATGMHHLVAAFPPSVLTPGDVLITNDPWMTAGQINDITIATPVFRAGRLVAWFASCCHSPDIGGRVLSAEANDVYEEGLRLPIMRLARAGEMNQELLDLIRANVRTPDETVGDLYAQISSNEVGAQSLLDLMDEFGLESIDPVAAEITSRSERAIREKLNSLPNGEYGSEIMTDGFDDEPVTLKVRITIADEDIHLDFSGSSSQSRHGVNVVLNYTRAYASFAIKAAISPDVPHNAGSFRPVHITAPKRSILNCEHPAPVGCRHLVGHFLPSLIFGALRPVTPERVLAPSSDALWMSVWYGQQGKNEPFMITLFQAGGSGARVVKDGLSATGFPGGLRAVPTEVIESLTPLMQNRRELRADSGGAGRYRGGLGQVAQMSCRSEDTWNLNGNADRVRFPAMGVDDGRPGGRGGIRLESGEALPRKRRITLRGEDTVRFELPGGGGFGHPYTRDETQVLADVVNGYVSLEAARTEYGVAVEFVGEPDAIVRLPQDYSIDHAETQRLRGSSAADGQESDRMR